MKGTPNFIGQQLEAHVQAWAEARKCDIAPALRIIKTCHTGTRKNGDFEINHPLTVAYIFTHIVDACQIAGGYAPLPQGETEAALRGLLCHDILEDTGYTREALRAEIGERAERIVYGTSKRYHLDAQTVFRKPLEQGMADLREDPLALVCKFIDRSHNLGTMVDIDGVSFVSKVVYTPEKQLEKMKEATFEFIPLADPARLHERYPAVYHPYVGVSCAYLIQTLSAVFGQCAAADMRRTFKDWRNTGQQEALFDTIRFPDGKSDGPAGPFCTIAARVPSVEQAQSPAVQSRKRKPADALAPTG